MNMKKIYPLIIPILIAVNAQAQWNNTLGPLMSSSNISMNISKLTVSGNNLCSIIGNTIYLSNNNGYSWKYSSYGVPYANCIAFSDSVIYAGTGSDGVYMSTNWGSTYAPINNGLPVNSQVKDILKFGNELLASVYDGNIHNVYYSTNNGATWTASSGLDTNYTIYCLATNGTNLYAGTNAWGAGIYMSSDSGHTWNSIGLANKNISSIAAYGNRLFAAENLSSGNLFFSQNNGVTWTLANNGLSPYVCSMAIDNNYIYAATYWNGVYYSSNNGTSWNALGLPCTSSITASTIALNGNYLYGGTGNGFGVSLNHGAWNCSSIKNYGLNIRSIVSKGNNLMTGTGTGNSTHSYYSLDTGQTWTTYLYSLNAFAVGDSGLFTGGNGFMMRFLNWGNNWTSVNIQGNPTIKDIVFKNSVGFSATSGSGIYYSGDNGMNWIQRNTGLSTLDFNKVIITDSAAVAGSSNAGIFVSTDLGLHWNAANVGMPDTCIQALAGYGNVFYAGTKNHGIYKSVDKGVTWLQAYYGVADTNVTALFTYGVNVFAGILGRGFLISSDSGVTWNACNNGLMDYNINSITTNGNSVFIGTGPPGQISYGGSVWKRNLSQLPLTLLTDISEVVGMNDISIYPIPATDYISINAPQKSNVELLNTQGQLLKSFITSDTKMNLNIMELPQGMYFLKIKTDEGGWIKKFTKAY